MLENEFPSVAVIGIGLMGSALTAALLRSGYRVNIWNRTPEKCASLAAQGANVSPSAEAAVAASGIIILAISDYANSKTVAASAGLLGKTVVQISTGSMMDAVEFHSFCTAGGAAEYMEVKIMTYPALVESGTSLLLASGTPEVYIKLKPLLETFGKSRFVGEIISSATSAMFAWSAHFQISVAGVLESIRAAKALGVEPALVQEIASFVGIDVDGIFSRWQNAADRIGPPGLAKSGTVFDYIVAADLIIGSTDLAGITLPVLNAVRTELYKWVDYGFGHADVEDAFEAARRHSENLTTG
ncbi:hypothetical protein CRX42_00685 [Pseudomonas jessenii]|uniref:6-phosphogluconate dehydrogenase NADP-binding domain-containing protein n=1 Tax=Pseudomonas jessenii TaxID=77298 RepID=A0A2W0FHH5_PSEJE|nr:NAD(P)-binding domain-containing protein [Pseudomonas jessenii]PYY72494.1 hypothetical protein CRX42_00685 [Pseudomonas jessenii]